MERLVAKYADKLVRSGLADPGAPVVGGLDAEFCWNREHEHRRLLEAVFAELDINSLVCSRPAEPYRTAVEFLAARAEGPLTPRDTETRTFLHDLPVIRQCTLDAVVSALRRRKGAIVAGLGVIASGTVTPEQGFVTFSSICFACFVKFFLDCLADLRRGRFTKSHQEAFERAVAHLPALPDAPPRLRKGPFEQAEEIHEALCEAGRKTVEYGLVDSYFGNISYLRQGVLYISQTGSSLDELEGRIDPCPLDGSSSAGITASSELPAHLEAVRRTGARAVLHGHPKFSVILSLDCTEKSCAFRGRCHTLCPKERFVRRVPIVPGEVGSGPYGLCRTVPPALERHGGVAVVYGHGVFTLGREDFNEAFGRLYDVERICREEYFQRVRRAGSSWNWKGESAMPAVDPENRVC